MKKLFSRLKNFFNNIYTQHFFIIAFIGFSFLVLDVAIRYFSNKYVLAYRFTHASPLFFSISWIFLFIMIFYLLPKKARMISYTTTTIIFNIITIAQILHMKTLNRFFGLSDVFLASEGSDYFLFALKKIDIFDIVLVITSIISMIIGIVLMKRIKDFKRDYQYNLIIISLGILLFSTFRFYAIKRLGEACEGNSWEAAYNVKNIYIDFNNQSKNMEVAGLYEQTFKNSYLLIKENLNLEKDKINSELDNYFEKNNLENSEKNKYTGTFEGKNLIFILMESIDSWLINKDVMPTLYNLQKDGWNFTNRYSPTFGGGQTINSEFAANVGLYAIDNSKAIYNFDQNFYPYSIANMMKENGYTVNSIHANTAKFYNRSNFHKALGYENHYALDDMKELDKSYDYFLDTSLVKNEEVVDLIIKDEPFMSFITTYSAHLPYDNENINCQSNLYDIEVKNNNELTCIHNLARDTDEFLKILIEKLEKKDILDNTVLVLFTDHYMYGYSNTQKILEYKNVTNTNLIQNVPFIIWNNNIKHKEIDTIMDTADIPPTLLNLFGYKYIKDYFVGTDVFDKEHESFVYFSNTSFYDGETYYDEKTKIDEEHKEYIQDILSKIQNKMYKNKNIILGNYFKYLENKN